VSAPVTVTVWQRKDGRDTRVKAEAWPTPVPGLVINQDSASGDWTVTHERSGAAVAYGVSRAEALGAAVMLGPAADWTRSGTDLTSDPEVRVRRRAIADTYGICLNRNAGLVSQAQLADAEAAVPGA
jgi:hypothetical protein